MAELDGHEMAKLIRCRRCSATFTSHAIHPPAVCPSCVVVLERRLAMAPVSALANTRSVDSLIARCCGVSGMVADLADKDRQLSAAHRTVNGLTQLWDTERFHDPNERAVSERDRERMAAGET